MKCATKDRNLNPCRGNAVNGKFCKIHHYMTEYTDEMVAQAKPCGTCRKTHYMGEYNTCQTCRERGSSLREKSKEVVILCAKKGCAFKQSENKYCGKHQLYMFLDETESSGMNACVNAVRGCRETMDPSYKFSRCQECLKKDREKDHEKRGVVVVGKQCTVCCKEYSADMFEGARGATLTCKNCRDANKRADEKRDVEHVKELARANAQKPERKEVKIAWREGNYEKVALYCLNHRQKMIEADLDGYHEHNAEMMKAWRDKNPEKVKVANQKRCENIEYAYGNYKRTAELKQLDFELSEEEFNKIVKTECSYCGMMQEKGFNGIDRVNSLVGYIPGNCVSCCAMCNYIKGCIDKYVFLHRIEHILTYNKFVDGTLFPEAFKEYFKTHNAKYQIYVNSAQIKGLQFALTNESFNMIISKNCYICGKTNTKTHQNGLDRINSNEGYIESNVHSCCGNCNYMKNNYTYKEFMDKCMMIYNHNKIENVIIGNQVIENKVVEIQYIENEVKETRNIVKGNKLSGEDRKEKNRLYKQRQRERLIAKYGDEEYKKMRAKEIAENRRKNR
jgi:hypothetical protein